MQPFIIRWEVYSLWVLVMVGWAFYIVKELRKNKFSKLTLLLAVPFAAWLLFTYVFIVHKSSHVAQLSGSRTFWSLWSNAWLPLAVGNLIGTMISLISLLCPPYSFKHWRVVILKIVIMVTLSLTAYHLFTAMPEL